MARASGTTSRPLLLDAPKLGFYDEILFLFRGVTLLVDLGGAVEGFGDAGANIFGAHTALEIRLPHELGGLFAGAAE